MILIFLCMCWMPFSESLATNSVVTLLDVNLCTEELWSSDRIRAHPRDADFTFIQKFDKIGNVNFKYVSLFHTPISLLMSGILLYPCNT